MTENSFTDNITTCFRKLVLISILLGSFAINARAEYQIALPPTPHKFVVIAHRGDHIEVPENTLAAYKEAIRKNVDYVEVDLRTTKDGHLVVLHDVTVNRMTGDKGAVSNLTYNEIKKMVIPPIRKTDTNIYHIPDFFSVLKLCKGHINIYLDFKNADVVKTYRLIKRACMQNHVVVYLNKKEQYAQWKKVAPQMPLMASLPKNGTHQQLNNMLKHKQINIVDNAYDAREIKFLHKKGIAVWLDVESADEGPAKWAKMLKLKPDGLQTDHPEKLKSYLKKRVR